MNRRLFWCGVAVGWAVMAVAIVGLVDQANRTEPAALGRLLVGLAIAHDLVLVPIVIVIGLLTARVVPSAVRPFVTAGLIATGVVSLFAVPMVLGRGRRPDDPSTLPLNYAHGLFQVLAVIWVAMLIAATVSILRRRQAVPPTSPATYRHAPGSP